MTTGNFKTVPIGSITINRGARQRRELVDLESLAESIKQVGLINPPVVSPDLILVAGERRFTACRDILNWTAIPVQLTTDLNPEELHLIELEENVKRVDLTWQDECRAIHDYHFLRATLEDGWTAAKSAAILGITESSVSKKLQVAEQLIAGDEMVCTADKYSVALGITERKKSRQKDNAGDEIERMLGLKKPETPGAEEVDTIDSEHLPEPEPAPTEEPATPRVPFLRADFKEWAAEYSGTKFNFLHCDFPYGVNANKHNSGAAKSFGGYEDTPDIYWELLDTLHLAMDNVVAKNAHMMFWFSMDFYEETRNQLQDMGWVVNPFPLIWFKSDNSGILPDPKRGPRRNYETALLCSRGDRMIVRAVSNVCPAPNIKNIHMSEKNPDMLRHFFRMFVDETTVILDPTMGSGNAIRVAEEMGAKMFLGIEALEENFNLAKETYLSSLQVAEK